MKKVRTDKAMPATSLDNRFNIDLLLAKEELTEAHDSMSTKMKAPTKIAKPHISKHAKLPIESKEHSGLTSGNSSSTGDKVATKSSGKSSVVQMTSQLKAELACQGKSTIRSHTDLSSGDDEDYVYGDNAEGGSALLSSGKDKNKRKAPRKPTKDEVALAQKLSKGQKRRLESIEKRKATEAKTADYLQVIAQHAISEEQRSLLVSGKQVGQTSSVKQMLSHLLKRHRAGLDLTPQERELLFPNGGALAEEAGEAFAHAEAETEEISVADTSMLLNTQGESTLLSLKSLTQSTPPSLSGAREMEREKEKEKAKARRKKTKSAGAADEEKHAEVQENGDKKDGDEFVSFGANLMAQLSALKASGRLPAAKSKEMLLAVTAAVDTGDDDAVAPLLVQVPASTGLAQVVPKEVIEYKTLTQTLRGEAPVAMYKATPLTLPMLDGKDADRILAYAHASSTSTAPSSSGPITAPKSKLVSGQRISVRRRDDIQQARMQLPVCAMEQEIVEAIIEDTSHLVGRGAGAEFISAYEGVPLSNKRAVVGSNGTDVVILCGETGSGKSTQVPQFLHEYGLTRHGMIGITQPRRVAATSTAERVAVELGEPITANGLGKKKAGLVGYQIRHDVSTVSDQTRIKFMTDGILIQEIMSDFLLRKYSVIILDEAHERNINTDMLLGLLSRCLPVRRAQAVVENEVWNRLPAVEKELYALPIRPLKLIIMSATLRVGDFVTPRLFPSPPPVLKVEARQYQVTTHFSKKTELDHYLKAAHKKVCQIHRKLPAGGILIFLTGKREIMHFVEKLQKSLGSRSKKRTVPRERGGAVSAHAENENEALEGTDANFHHSDFGGLDVDEACGEAEGDDLDSIGSISDSDSEADSDFQYDEEDAQQKTVAASGAGAAAPVAAKVLTEEEKTRARMLRRALGQSEDEPEAFVQGQIGQTDVDSKASNAHDVDVGELQPQAVFVLPLFAMMTAEQQAKVFREPPAGSRLIVVATNVAETSITIPNIRYVVDSGRQKVKTRNISSGVSKFEVAWISQAQAEQRKGRAGRTGPGHVYRLYSANFFDQHMPQFGVPEIMSIPLEGLLLQMKSIGVTDLASFPFPTQPPAQSLTTAVNTLLYLGAIERVPSNIGNIPAHMRWLLASKEQATVEENITPLGMLLAKIPISQTRENTSICAPERRSVLVQSCLIARGCVDGVNTV